MHFLRRAIPIDITLSHLCFSQTAHDARCIQQNATPHPGRFRRLKVFGFLLVKHAESTRPELTRTKTPHPLDS